jgi:hypothetical protein
MNTMMSNAWFHKLKNANRQLIKHNGGIEECAKIISLSSTQIGRCHNDKDPDLLQINHAIQLEVECGNYYVTRAMAELHGCQLHDPTERPIDGRCVMRDNAELQIKNSELQVGLHAAASDNVITATEALRALRDLQPVKQKVADLETGLTEILAKGGIKGDLKLVYGG